MDTSFPRRRASSGTGSM